MATATRPLVFVKALDGDMATNSTGAPLPDVLCTLIRLDLIRSIHKLLSCNKRQPYVVACRTGHQTSTESWGTRARPRVSPMFLEVVPTALAKGAFDNMCRDERMFTPTKI
jgi:large subunit ribosomal protein L4e